MKKTLWLSLLFASSSLFAYEACAPSQNEALEKLSSMILSNVENSFTKHTSVDKSGAEENVDQKIDSILRVSSNLSFVKQDISTKDGSVCVKIDPKEQVEHTEQMLTKVLAFSESNLAKDINEKLKKTQEYLKEIEQTSNLVTAFLKPSYLDDPNKHDLKKISAKLQSQEKIFRDIYNESLLKANAMVFKSCAKTQEEAYSALNEQLFKSKTKQKDDEGFFDKTASFFSKLNPFAKEKSKMLDLFAQELRYVKNGNEECALIEKEKLYNVATLLNQELQRFHINTLSKNPKERYEQIQDLQEHLNVTKALLEIFPKKFHTNDFAKITHTKKELAKLLETTHPQSVTFKIAGDAQNVKIMLQDKFVASNTPLYLKEGSYTYTITAKEKCPIKGEFNLELLEDISIDKDFSSMNLPIINFYTKEETRIIVDGKTVRPNVETSLQKCQGEVRYIASYADQEKSGTISLEPNFSKTIELRFFTPGELALFNDAKTKQFTTSTDLAFSESLSPLSHQNIEFILNEDVKNGTLQLHERGSFTYKAKENFVGVDSFSYSVEIYGEKSPPKIANITVTPAQTQAVVVVETKAENNASKVVEVQIEKPEDGEARYQKFKAFVEKNVNEGNIDKVKKLQESYPDMFERILQEKQAGM
ncbi:MAG: Ig-like domain-containing protein [Sulfurimonas sp.]|jgi:hypothetical protein|nr:Ig-like domain-containing protein [Sulfurimonas sp.]